MAFEAVRIGFDLGEGPPLLQLLVDVGARRLGDHPKPPPGEFGNDGRFAGARRPGDYVPAGQADRDWRFGIHASAADVRGIAVVSFDFMPV
jgi:hypothetical protein